MMKKDLIGDSEDFLHLIIEKLGIDILFECYLGLLIYDKKIKLEDTHVIPKENNKRNFKNDITHIPNEIKSDLDLESNFFHQNHNEGLIVYTSRSAIIDYLPEDIYAEPDNFEEQMLEEQGTMSTNEYEKYKKRAKEEFRKRQKLELKSAQRFFSPLEIEYNKIRLNREINELESLDNFDKVLSSFWTNRPIDNDKRRRFVRTLHLVPYIIGDKEKTGALINYVLGEGVNLKFSIEESFEIDPKKRRELTGNEQSIGYNMVLGSRVFDYLEICTLAIENLTTSEFLKYFDDNSEEKQLVNEIINHYFPLNVEVRLDFTIKEETLNTTEKGEENIPNRPVAILGFSSKLGK